MNKEKLKQKMQEHGIKTGQLAKELQMNMPLVSGHIQKNARTMSASARSAYRLYFENLELKKQIDEYNGKRIKNIAKICNVKESDIVDFFKTWEGFYNLVSEFSDVEFAEIIKQHI